MFQVGIDENVEDVCYEIYEDEFDGCVENYVLYYGVIMVEDCIYDKFVKVWNGEDLFSQYGIGKQFVEEQC